MVSAAFLKERSRRISLAAGITWSCQFRKPTLNDSQGSFTVGTNKNLQCPRVLWVSPGAGDVGECLPTSFCCAVLLPFQWVTLRSTQLKKEQHIIWSASWMRSWEQDASWLGLARPCPSPMGGPSRQCFSRCGSQPGSSSNTGNLSEMFSGPLRRHLPGEWRSCSSGLAPPSTPHTAGIRLTH